MNHLDSVLYNYFKKTNSSNKFEHVKIPTCVLPNNIASYLSNVEKLSTVVQLHEGSVTGGFSFTGIQWNSGSVAR